MSDDDKAKENSKTRRKSESDVTDRATLQHLCFKIIPESSAKEFAFE